MIIKENIDWIFSPNMAKYNHREGIDMYCYEERAKGGVGLITPGICRVNDMQGAATYLCANRHKIYVDL